MSKGCGKQPPSWPGFSSSHGVNTCPPRGGDQLVPIRGGQTSGASCVPHGKSVTSSGVKLLAPVTPRRTLCANTEPHEGSLTLGCACLRAPFL